MTNHDADHQPTPEADTTSEIQPEEAALAAQLLTAQREQARLEKLNAELIAAHQELLREKITVDTMTGHVGDGLILADTAGFVTIANASAGQLLTASDRLPGRNLISAFPSFPFRELFDELLDRQSAGRQVSRAAIHAGRYMEITAELVVGPEEDPGSCVISLRDMTMEQRRERAKSAVIGIISHELRTPLTSIIGNLQLLADAVSGELPSPQDHLLQEAREATRRLTRLVDDLIQFADSVSGQQPMLFRPVNVGQCADHVCTEMQEMADEAHVAVVCDVTPDMPTVLGDAEQLNAVIRELVRNGITVSPPEATVHVTVSSADECVLIRVKDEGQGIHPLDQQMIFEPFLQTEDYLTRSHDGLGIGLPLVRHIVTSHGGTITLSSEPGNGAEFTVSLPAADPAIASRLFNLPVDRQTPPDDDTNAA